MPIQPLEAFFSQPEQRLLAKVLMPPEHDHGTLELLAAIGSGRGAGSTLLKRWVEAGFLRERRLGNQRRLSANPDFLLYPELRTMVLKTIGLRQPMATALAPLKHRITDAFIFGSIASGTDHGESDIDLAVIGDINLFDLSPLLDPVEKIVGRPVHLSIYSEAEWESPADPVLQAIKQGPRIDLMGAMRDEQTA